VLGGEAAEEFGDVFIRVVGAHWLLLCSGHLGHCVLADLFVRWPVLSLAVLGLDQTKFNINLVGFSGSKGRYSRSNLWSSA
jgi:hypothetical protein